MHCAYFSTTSETVSYIEYVWHFSREIRLFGWEVNILKVDRNAWGQEAGWAKAGWFPMDSHVLADMMIRIMMMATTTTLMLMLCTSGGSAKAGWFSWWEIRKFGPPQLYVFKNATTPKLNVWNLCSSFSVSNNPLREQCCTYNVFSHSAQIQTAWKIGVEFL